MSHQPPQAERQSAQLAPTPFRLVEIYRDDPDSPSALVAVPIDAFPDELDWRLHDAVR